MTAQPQTQSSLLNPYIQIARVDHWIKNVFVLPGVLVALSIDPGRFHALDFANAALGVFALCLITSSNYVLNEILDAASDRFHPLKSARPVAAGRVRLPLAWLEWIALMAAALGLGSRVSLPFTLTLLALWIAGCAYNIPPVRTKDLPYVDVVSEAINNPLRMLAGWYLTKTAAAPITSLLISYWMAGCYFMAIKRYSEFRELSRSQLHAYRKSFQSYSERSLLTTILFYGSHAMLFFGAFVARYRIELVLSFPLVGIVMAFYFSLAFRPNSPVQNPEGLYREPLIVAPAGLCALVMCILLFVDVPILHTLFRPTKVGF